MPVKSGRPKGTSAARQQLLDAAREKFTLLPYEKVSTRLIAEAAGVNAALIRYYFGGKAGLFEQMLRETMAPLRRFFADIEHGAAGTHSLETFMRTYYRAIAPNPDVPKLILRVMSDPAAAQRPLVEQLIGELARGMQRHVFDNPHLLRGLRSGISPTRAKMTVFSLTLFPFLVPESILNLQGFSLEAEGLDALLEHNIQVLRHGLFNADKKTL